LAADVGDHKPHARPVPSDYFLTLSHNDSRSLPAAFQPHAHSKAEVAHNFFYWRILQGTYLLSQFYGEALHVS
jgi:hypothetical protein